MDAETVSGKLRQMSETLLDIERHGAEVDEPEGERYVRLSDSLINVMAGALAGLAQRLEGDLEGACRMVLDKGISTGSDDDSPATGFLELVAELVVQIEQDRGMWRDLLGLMDFAEHESLSPTVISTLKQRFEVARKHGYQVLMGTDSLRSEVH